MNQPTLQKRNKSTIALIFIPLASCIVASVSGILIGQAGNFLYALFGKVSTLLCIPAYCCLFLASIGVSLLVNWLLNKVIKA